MENKILTTNFHTHTTRCNHAVGEDRQYVEAAIKGGLKVLGFSDHSPYFFSGDYYSTFRRNIRMILRSSLDSRQSIIRSISTSCWNFTASILLIISLWGSILS